MDRFWWITLYWTLGRIFFEMKSSLVEFYRVFFYRVFFTEFLPSFYRVSRAAASPRDGRPWSFRLVTTAERLTLDVTELFFFLSFFLSFSFFLFLLPFWLFTSLVRPSFFRPPSFSTLVGFEWVTLGFSGLWWVIMGYDGLWWVTPSSAKWYQVTKSFLLGFYRFFLVLKVWPRFSRLY